MNGDNKADQPETISDGQRPPYALPVDRIALELHTNPSQGLSDAEVAERLRRYGPNQLREEPGPSFWQLLLGQFSDFLIILLIVAALVSLFIGEYLDAIVIIAIVLVNAGIGVFQEQRAGQALRALQRLAGGRVRVIRAGSAVEVQSQELVPGDVVLLEVGNYVPADIRLFEAVNLQVNEAPLTGESVPAKKRADTVLDPTTPLGDVSNSVFLGTTITYGRGKGIVTATGMETELGEIARMLQTFEDQVTPLQRKLAELGQFLGYAVIGVAIVVAGVGLLQGRELLETFLVAVSLAVAAIPEGLPAVVTVVLSIGLQRMARRHALIRRLPAVETLGATTTIASDKTGTLTKGEMTVVRIHVAGQDDIEVTGEGYYPEGVFRQNGRVVQAGEDPLLSRLLTGAALANDAILEESGESDYVPTWRIVGDPTEGALLVVGGKAGLWRKNLDKQYPRRLEVPFSAERKLMTTIHEHAQEGVVAFVKGAPDAVLERSTRIATSEGVRDLSPTVAERIKDTNQEFGEDALRVLAVAYRDLEALPAEPESVEGELVFLGLVGMIDPARPEAKVAVDVARKAGIRSIMITGDHKVTAVAIASQLGILRPDGLALSGAELDEISDEELDGKVDQIDVYARSSPRDKVRVIDALRKKGHIVAMTGDGVNDAPALKRADIGIAMGITGTDVSKEAAAMVLTDDNFASIVAAVEEGRVIFANIRKFVAYLLSANLGEILVIFIGILAGLPLVLQPIQILWINLVTDGFPALALGVEKGEPGIMDEPPRPPGEAIIAGRLRYWLVFQGALDATATLAAFIIGLQLFPNQLAGAETMAFVTLGTAELLRAFSARSLHQPVIRLGLLTNRTMLLAAGGSFILLLIVVYTPFLQPAFSTITLGVREWAVVLPLAFVPFVGSEIAKAAGLFSRT